MTEFHALTGPPGNCECGDALNTYWHHVELGQGVCAPWPTDQGSRQPWNVEPDPESGPRS